MRFRSMLCLLAVLSISFMTLIFIPPINGITHDNYEVPPGAPIPLKLEEFDRKGDILKLTIVFKGTASEDFVPRPINIVILDKSQADRIPRYEIAREQGFFVKENISERIEEEINCPTDGQKSILFFNPMQEGDLEDWDNATVRVKIDYHVENAKIDSGTNILPIIVILLLIAFTITAIVMAVKYFKRRSRDTRTFFNPEEGAYYVFKSILDDRIYYFDAYQYTQLYNSNSLDEYDYLGTATRIGGPVMPPENLGMEAALTTPMGEQMMLSPPLVGGQGQLDLTSMEAVPVAPPPAEPEQHPEGGEDVETAPTAPDMPTPGEAPSLEPTSHPASGERPGTEPAHTQTGEVSSPNLESAPVESGDHTSPDEGMVTDIVEEEKGTDTANGSSSNDSD